MPASLAPVAILKSSSLVLLLLALLEISVAAQTSLNDVHIMPRQPSPLVTGPANSLELVEGSYLHVIKEEANLVLVSVSVTDPMQRLVTGLAPENFQVFDGKKPQRSATSPVKTLPSRWASFSIAAVAWPTRRTACAKR